MRHRKRGRQLGRSSSHKKAMLRNLASSLFLTEREGEFDDNAPKVKGRVVTTLHKAKEVRPLVEKCITIARRSLKHSEAASELATSAERNTAEWKSWRTSDQWRQWADARAPVVNARRRVFQLLRDKEAVRICFDEVAPRFAERTGGYTRVVRLANPRLGDAGLQALLEFVGQNDRVASESERPSFSDDTASESDEVANEPVSDEVDSSADEQTDDSDAGEQEEEKKD